MGNIRIIITMELPFNNSTTASVENIILGAESTCQEPWNTISIIVGWTYLVAWSASFFPQAIENY